MFFIGTPKVWNNENFFISCGVNVTPYSFLIASNVAAMSVCLSRLIKILPSGSTRMDMMFVSGIFISEIDAGVTTWTGSFFTKLAVSMKKVSSSTVTSLMAVMSMNIFFF